MSEPTPAAADRAQGTGAPHRVLSGASLLALGLNGVVGVGIFFLPATLAARAPGPGGLVVLVLTALALAPVALTFATLARRFDQDGGPSVYARAAFGDRVGFAVGWVAYVSAVASSAAVIAGLCRYSVAAWAGLSGGAERAAAVLVALLLSGLGAAGLLLSSRVWTFLTVAKLLPLVALGVLGLVRGSGGQGSAGDLGAAAGWGSAALAATFAFQGFEIVPVVAGHAQRSERAVPRAMVGALLIAAVLYVLLHRACLGAVAGLASSKAPLAEAAGSLGGAAWAALLGAATNVSSLGIAFGMVTMTPRYLAVLSGELGAPLGQESAAGVPLRAALVTAALVAVLLSLGSLAELLTLSSVAVLTQYGVTALALGRLAWRRQRGLRPLDAWPVPLALATTGVLLSGASAREAVVALAAVGIGLLARAVRQALQAR